MKEVTKERFYEVINPLDVCLHVIGCFPFTTEFRLKHSVKMVGRIDESFSPETRYPVIERFYIAQNIQP